MTNEIQELSEESLIRLRWGEAGPFAVYFFTPWCGTCKYGEKMLNVVKAMAPNAVMYRANVNFMPSVVQEWKIESVPCLAFVEDKRVTEKLYTMRSVEFLLQRVRERLP
ncbi:thioredoxin family protein [Paenibacillus sp. TRM 82003]|nr:thioredoxin family protein [Paenibacillus sp. TRM 82003]